jgi:hypothetical protein
VRDGKHFRNDLVCLLTMMMAAIYIYGLLIRSLILLLDFLLLSRYKRDHVYKYIPVRVLPRIYVSLHQKALLYILRQSLLRSIFTKLASSTCVCCKAQLSREKRPSHDGPDRLSRWPHLEERKWDKTGHLFSGLALCITPSLSMMAVKRRYIIMLCRRGVVYVVT